MRDERLEERLRARWEEFAPGETEAAAASFDRRTFLKLMGGALALAGVGELGGCSKPQPLERIVPRVTSPEGAIPGIPRFYASVLPMGLGGDGGWMAGYGRGIIVEQHEGRPTKIEGNPDHPSSLGGTDLFMQAAILQLYDPDRSKQCLRGKEPVSWGGVVEALRQAIAKAEGSRAGGVRVRVLTGRVTSPTIIAQMRQLKGLFPGLIWHVYDSMAGGAGGVGNARRGLRQALGRAVLPVYDFGRARRIVALESHFLFEEPGSVQYAREFAFGRRLRPHALGPNLTHVTDGADGDAGALSAERMSRLHVAESSVTFTGAMADHRLAAGPGMMPAVAERLARGIGGNGGGGPEIPAKAAEWVDRAAADLRGSGGEGLVVVGEYLPAEVHALGATINGAIGAVGKTVRYLEPVEEEAGEESTLQALAEALDRREVDLLVIIGVNPAYSAPGDVAFGERLAQWTQGGGVALSVAPYPDETAALCGLHVPLAHPLEAWGDLRGHEGTAGIVQPLIQPLYGGKSAVEVLGALGALGAERGGGAAAGGAVAPSAADVYAEGYALVRRHWMAEWKEQGEARWNKALQAGVIEGSGAREIEVAAGAADMGKALAAMGEPAKAGAAGAEKSAIELVIRPDPALGDGAWANHPWLQELPRPLSRITWDNVALLSPALARKLGIEDGHGARKPVGGVKVSAHSGSVVLPAWVQPGHPEETVTVFLGGGRRLGGGIQKGVGVDVATLRTAAKPWGTSEGVGVETAAGSFVVACTQPQQTTEDRDIARQRNVGELPEEAEENRLDLYSMKKGEDGKKVHLSLYDENLYNGYKWGMVIDLSACIGCQACVVACQAENNIPTVGKEQVCRGREMHWLRIDTYFGGMEARGLGQLGAEAEVRFQPMLCQHCENAPCEVVCPVEATSHSSEGLNEMTYNRCVGTRYCSNNCPYKVRRFNFLQYNDASVESWKLQKNPNVTVRSRGVMEKCTYCVQRINRTRIAAKRAWAREAGGGAAVEMRTPAGGSAGWEKPEALPRMRLQTACQQACPTEAIVFGDMNDGESLVARLKDRRPWSQINYGVLTELNTQPRTTYLERLINRAGGGRA
jgi:molybdopterin-containing oxidoreductase family iron-sulfur binding subunit